MDKERSVFRRIAVVIAAAGGIMVILLCLLGGPHATFQVKHELVSVQNLIGMMIEEGASVEEIEYVIRDKPDRVHDRNRIGMLPLAEAVSWRRHDVALVLLKHGADVDGKSNGTTPLYRAVARGDAQMVELLLIHGADPFADCGAGIITPYRSAMSDGTPEVRALLEKAAVERGGPPPEPTQQQIRDGIGEMLRSKEER